MENDDKNQKSHMIIYTTEDGLAKIETTFDEAGRCQSEENDSRSGETHRG